MLRALQILFLVLVAIAIALAALSASLSGKTGLLAGVTGSVLVYLALLSRLFFRDPDAWQLRALNTLWRPLLGTKTRTTFSCLFTTALIALLAAAIMRQLQPQALLPKGLYEELQEERELLGEERQGLNSMLLEEIQLVNELTLGRRNSRLLYIISEPSGHFLEEDIAHRFDQLGISEHDLPSRLRHLAQIETTRAILEQSTAEWDLLRAQNPELPLLTCTAEIDQVKERVDLTRIESLFLDDYARSCRRYLEVRYISGPNGDLVESMINTRRAVETRIAERLRSFVQARRGYLDPSQNSPTTPAGLLGERFQEALTEVGEPLQDLSQVSEMETALRTRGLQRVASSLDALATIEALKIERGCVRAAIAKVAGQEPTTWLYPPASSSQDALRTKGPFGSSSSVTALRNNLRQIELKIAVAERQRAVFERTLELLIEQDDAYRLELSHLGRAELARRAWQRDCIAGDKVVNALPTWLVQPVKAFETAKCRERFVGLLSSYSAAWKLGRLKAEESGKKLVAQAQEDLLDHSEFTVSEAELLLQHGSDNSDPWFARVRKYFSRPDQQEVRRLTAKVTLIVEEAKDLRRERRDLTRSRQRALQRLREELFSVKEANESDLLAWRYTDDFRRELFQQLTAAIGE